jgi:hypothetical protein
MEYVKVSELNSYLRSNNLKIVGTIDKSGSVKGMNKLYNWQRYKKIKSGNYIYAVEVK